MRTYIDAEAILDAAVYAMGVEADKSPVEQYVTNALIRRYAAATGFDIEAATRFVESEYRDC